MTSRDRAYIAGFFDGEGYIGTRKDHRSGRLYWRVTVAQKDPTILYWIQKTTGFGRVRPVPSSRIPDSYTYQWQPYAQQEIWDFITLIYPYVKCPKRRQRLRDARKLLASRGFDKGSQG